MMHHSFPAWCAERSMLNCFLTSRQSQYQACCPLERLEMRWGKGESDRLASHSMGQDGGQDTLGWGLPSTAGALTCPPPLALLPCAATDRDGCCWKLCWGTCMALAMLPGSARLHWAQRLSQQILYPVLETGKKMKWAELTYLLPFYSTAITFSTTGTSLKIKEIEN